MRSEVIVAFLLSCVATSATFLGSPIRWLKPVSHDDSITKRNRMLRIRGGNAAETTPANGSKIKGHCIGIDLGTTYRYDRSPLTNSSCFHLIFVLFVKLCCRMERWSGGNLSE